MAQIRGTAGYQLGNQNPFGGPSKDAGGESSPLDTIREYTAKIEDVLDNVSEPIKPYVSSRSRLKHPI
jgi:ER-derived vesicles protein